MGPYFDRALSDSSMDLAANQILATPSGKACLSDNSGKRPVLVLTVQHGLSARAALPSLDNFSSISECISPTKH